MFAQILIFHICLENLESLLNHFPKNPEEDEGGRHLRCLPDFFGCNRDTFAVSLRLSLPVGARSWAWKMVLGTSCWMACHSILGDQKLNSVHLSLHENIMNVDEMDGKWKVETGPFFFFQVRFLNFIQFLFKHPLLPMVCVSGSWSPFSQRSSKVTVDGCCASMQPLPCHFIGVQGIFWCVSTRALCHGRLW